MAIRKTLAAFAAVAALCAPALAQDESATAVKVGDDAPAFTAKDAEGKEHSLADYKGKVVVLEWTNPQCPFVKKHYANGDMQALAGSFDKEKVVWLGVNSSHFNTAEDSKGVAGEWKVEHPVLLDSDGKIGNAYGAKTTPHMFVINAEGKVAYQGAIDSDNSSDADKVKGAENYVTAAVNALLEGKPVEKSSTKPYGCSVKYAAKE